MPRHDHNIRRTTAAAYPSQLIAVSARGTWEDTGELPRTEVMRLASWHGIGCQGRAGLYGPDRRAEGSDCQSFWEALDKRLAKGGAVWAFAPYATRTFGLLGLWEQIESGDINIVGRDHRDTQDTRLRGLPKLQANGGAAHEHGESVGAPGMRHLSGNVRSEGAGERSGAVQRNQRGLGYVVLEDPPVVLDCRRRGLSGTLRIVDIRNYGVAINTLPAPGAGCAAVTMALVRSMIATLLANRLGSLKATVASQSMTAFTTSHLTHVTQAHNDLRALGIEERGYYGGRCEAFRLGALPGPVWHLDVSAMYPSVYATESVPVCLHSVRAGMPAGEVLGHNDAIRAIADVTVSTDEPAYPLRHTGLKLVVWPVGEFRTTLAGAELAHALNERRVTKIHNVAYYHTAPLLASYAECVLRLRAETRDNPALNQWSKALGNCLVGKFGQRDRRWVKGESTYHHERWDTWEQRNELRVWERWRSIGDYVQREEVGSWSCDAVPAIACFVCAAARMRLLTLIRCAGWENVFYCDTDSLMVSNIGVARLAMNGWMATGVPGMLRVKAENRTVRIYGIKDYEESGARVKAGVPLADRAALASLGSIWTEPTVAGHCRRKSVPSASRVNVSYSAHGVYRHGTRQKDGTVKPLRFGGLHGEKQEGV